MKIYLVGFMGAGKTTYGTRLSKFLRWEFVDLDELVADKAGISINEIFQMKGEDGFREMESEVLRSTERYTNTVVATGGGTPCFGDNLEWMNRVGQTVYLKVSEEELYQRLLFSRAERPLIRDLDDDQLLGFVRDVLGERERYYLQAQFVVDPVVTPFGLVRRMEL